MGIVPPNGCLLSSDWPQDWKLIQAFPVDWHMTCTGLVVV